MLLWVLSLLYFLEPRSPYEDTFVETAEAIALASKDRRDAATLVSIAWHESRFKPSAVGDHGASLGLFQVQPATANAPREELLDPLPAARHALRLAHLSWRICGARPREERLAWYAGGGNGCPEGRAARLSRSRVALADRLLQVK